MNDPLFDGSGLRNWVYQKACEHRDAGKQLVSYLPARQGLAFCIDDESAYAYSHGYIAWRFGFQSRLVTSRKLMDKFLQSPSTGRVAGTLTMTFEDLYLNFPDREGLQLSKLHHRDKRYSGLKTINHRILATTGANSLSEKKVWSDNQEYLLQITGRCNVVYKPGGGIFDTWRRSGMEDELQIWKQERSAKDFVEPRFFAWPPKRDVRAADDKEPGGHSSPGVLLMVADRLIARAKSMYKADLAIESAVFGATLATMALELLGDRTPTLALEALMLKHQFETMAECQFVGIQHNFDMQARFRDIENELAVLSQGFDQRHVRRCSLNAYLTILHSQVVILRNQQQFDEEEACLAKIRELRLQLLELKASRHRLLWLGWPFIWYINLLMASLGRLVLGVVLWVIGLIACLACCDKVELPKEWLSIAFNAFIGIQADNTSTTTFVITCIAMLAGMLHIGILVSMVYAKLVRK
jgi:hypothetical protein